MRAIRHQLAATSVAIALVSTEGGILLSLAALAALRRRRSR